MISLVGHAKPVRSLAFSPTGAHLVSGGDDGRAVVWTPPDRVPGHVIALNLGSVGSVACHPDGEWFCAAWRYPPLSTRATGHRDHVRFWELESGKVAHGGEPGEARYWHRVAGIDALEISVFDAELVRSLAFTPAGELFFLDYWAQPASSQPPKLWVAHYRAGAYRDRVDDGWVERRRDVQAFAVSHDGTSAAVATNDWVRAGPLGATKVPPGYPTKGAVRALVLSAGDELLTAARSDRLTVWDAAGSGAVRVFDAHSTPVAALAAHPTESLLGSVDGDGTVLLWEPESGAVRHRYNFRLGAAHALAFAPDGLTLAVGGDRGVVCFDLD